ncbi:TIGR04222 domain-containing membrane protein [Saccharothrix sp. HUAS TT1]|uniref:TIGR04222 domain-containing membrane protein n=1 Tax=Saccharothrix sp. HUAS TT1 TaxID=3231910 RepID=UPI00345BAFF4
MDRTGLTLEEQGFLVAGPGRAAEVAVVALVEAGAVRISREGKVSAIGRPRAASPLQDCVLRKLSRPLGDVIASTASSGEAGALRQHLVERGFVVPAGRRRVVRGLRYAVVAAAVALVIITMALELPFAVAAAAVVGGVLLSVLLGRLGRQLTGAGRAVVRRLDRIAVSPNRIALVAYYGLLGKGGRHHVWETLGLSPAASATLRRRDRVRGSSGGASCGGGCGSCAGSGCGSGSSGGSDSGGSSCGGGGCGGGGGGD